MHNDYTEWSGPQRVRDILPDEADDLLTGRFAIIQVWRPIRYPVETFPLAICDAHTVASDDFIISERSYQDRKGQTYACAYNPKHHWYWFPRMRREEAMVFKVYDSLKDGRGAVDRAHRLRRSDIAAECAPTRKHRDQDVGVFLERRASVEGRATSDHSTAPAACSAARSMQHRAATRPRRRPRARPRRGSIERRQYRPAEKAGAVWPSEQKIDRHRHQQGRQHGDRQNKECPPEIALAVPIGVAPFRAGGIHRNRRKKNENAHGDKDRNEKQYAEDSRENAPRSHPGS